MASKQPKNDCDDSIIKRILNFKTKNATKHLSIYIWNYKTNKRYAVLENGNHPMNVYKIIYDPEYKFIVEKINNEYYCNTEQDLQTIVNYITDHSELYEYKITDDVLDHPEIVEYTTQIDD